MKCYTFEKGQLTAGISLVADPRLGQVVFLGEEGRGRHYQKVALGRNNPAEVIDGQAQEAYPKAITVSKGTENERTFFVLEKPHNDDEESILVRVCTKDTYTRDSVGYWKPLQGEPETLTAGWGAHGDAGRIGNWDDGLVVMRLGDALFVKPEGGHKTPPFVIMNGAIAGPTCITFEQYELEKALALERE